MNLRTISKNRLKWDEEFKQRVLKKNLKYNPQSSKYLQMIIDEVTTSFFACYWIDSKCKACLDNMTRRESEMIRGYE